MRPINVFYSRIIIMLLFGVVLTWGMTQWVAHYFDYHVSLYGIAGYVEDTPIYWPPMWIAWSVHYFDTAPDLFKKLHIGYSLGFVGAVFLVIAASMRRTRRINSDSFGSARWATDEDLKQGGYFAKTGVVLGQTQDARTQIKLEKGKDDPTSTVKRLGKNLIIYKGDDHILACAPTRSGKGVGLIIPTLLTWRDSVFVYDIKGENYAASAGFRKQFSVVINFSPTQNESLKFNPLLEVRKGDLEVRDVQNIATVLVDPSSSKDELNHWESSAQILLTGVILHVLYACEEKSLAQVLNFITDPTRTVQETLTVMRDTPHTADGPHPVCQSVAQQMLNKAYEELSGVISSSVTLLQLYSDPVVARNTATSDFTIDSLIHSEHPYAFYFIVPPPDLVRTRALVRLLITQFCGRLTEDLEAAKKRPHRTLLLLDEFASLGRFKHIEASIAFLAGYGVNCFLICQTQDQLESLYGVKNGIRDNCKVNIFFGAVETNTSRTLSELIGKKTERRRQLNFSGSRIAPWLSNVMESDVEMSRELMTPDEILTMPADEQLIKIASLPVYRGKKIYYYQDKRFEGRHHLPVATSATEMTKELRYLNIDDVWQNVKADPIKIIKVNKSKSENNTEDRNTENEIDYDAVEIEDEKNITIIDSDNQDAIDESDDEYLPENDITEDALEDYA